MNLKVYRYLVFYSLVFLLLVGLELSGANKAIAQNVNDIYTDVVPENPAPGEDTSITLSSYLLDLNASKITWIVGGKSVLSGVGQKYYSLRAPTAGSETTVTIQVTSSTGTIETKIVIRPSVMVVLWQADDSYVPPFYKGKALPTPDSAIKIIAMPEVKVGTTYLNPKNMTYSWRKDFTNDPEASGYGKNYFTYISDYLDASNFIEVNATTIDQKFSSTSSTTVGTFQPKLVFYRNSENMGTEFEHSITDGHKIINKEILFAAPYFISPKNIRIPRLVWSWSINGTRVFNEGFQKNILPLQVESGVSGTSKLKLEIENLDKVFQTASKELNLTF